MKLAKVLALFVAVILAFVFISAPVAISGGGSTDKHPWDEDQVGEVPENDGGYVDYTGGDLNGDDELDDPNAETNSTGFDGFYQNINLLDIVQTVVFYQSASFETNRSATNVTPSK